MMVLVSCDNGGRSVEQTRVALQCSQTLPGAEWASSGCYGLYVSLTDRSMVSVMRPDNGYLFARGPYDLGEPITVTTAIVVLGEGSLLLPEGFNPARDYNITLVEMDRHARVPVMVETERQGEQESEAAWLIVDQNNPYVESFRIDEWFEFPDVGVYELTVTRIACISDTLRELSGNPVVFEVYDFAP